MAQRCALLWSCVTRSRNQFYVFFFCLVRNFLRSGLLCGAGLRVELHAVIVVLICGLDSSCAKLKATICVAFCVFSCQRFRVRDFSTTNSNSFLWSEILRVKGHFTKFSSLNTFSPGKRHISAPPEMRRNAEISMAAESLHLCGANWHNKNADKVFLRGCYTITSKQQQSTA